MPITGITGRRLALGALALTLCLGCARIHRPLTVTIDDAEARARAVVDLAAWRAFQLLIPAFVLFVVYRLIASRRAR